MNAKNLVLPLSNDIYLKDLGLSKSRKPLLPLNIQLFAGEGGGEGGGEPNPPKTYTQDDIDKLTAERDKLKQANDKLSKENAEHKRKDKEKLTEEERVAQERAEQDQKLKNAEQELTTIKMSKELLVAGFDETTINTILESFNKGDSVEFAKVLATSVKTLVENVRKEEKETFQRSSTIPPAGSGGKTSGLNPQVEKYINNRNANGNKARELLFGKQD